ncbi:MAG: AAA family ATPase [Candidatus Cloacimonetes bacterium]|nr:AAA family ATPase [Candidatus Cloacimonadota bacterium]
MKIYIIGTSCSGKTTLAGKLAKKLELVHIELDQIWWQPGWQELEAAEFRKRVANELAINESWVVDGNYKRVSDLFLAEVDMIIWLNLPFYQVFQRSITRTIRRIFTGEIICNGNRENWDALFSRDGMPAWVIRSHRSRKQYGKNLQANDKRVIELRNCRQIKEFLQELKKPVFDQ